MANNIHKCRSAKTYAAIVAILMISGCTYLPASGPYGMNMDSMAMKNLDEGKEQTSEFRYALIRLTKDGIATLDKVKKAGVYDWPAMGGSFVPAVSVGDTVSVTIYESQSGGLFIPVEAGVRPGNFVSIPAQVIDQTGVINIPFAGEIKAAGRAPSEIGKEIEEKLGVRAIEPQAVVSVIDRKGAEASVIGEVNSATKFSLGLSGEKILDAIARAGGPKHPGYETLVTLQRGGKEWTIPFDQLIESPSKNINLRPKDTVYLSREAPSFQVYGASGVNGSYNFRKSQISLAEAIGEARGLADGQADPAEVYVYRQESRKDLEAMSVNLDYTEAELRDDKVSVIYKVDMREANGFFLAQKFPMEDQDIVYIANAASVEFKKFLDLLNPTSVTKINTQNAVEQKN